MSKLISACRNDYKESQSDIPKKKTVILEERDRIAGRTWGAGINGTTLEISETSIAHIHQCLFAVLEQYSLKFEASIPRTDAGGCSFITSDVNQAPWNYRPRASDR